MIILGIIENLRKIKASRAVLLLGAPDRACIFLILYQSCYNLMQKLLLNGATIVPRIIVLQYLFMKNILGIVVLGLLWCNTAFALPKCQGEDISKWTKCEGVKITSKGSKYSGEFKDGKYHGQGTITNTVGDKYIGGWKDGEFYGKGTLTYSNGDKKNGIWKNSKVNEQNSLTVSTEERKKKLLKTIDENSIKKVIDKITKGDGLQKTDLTKVINQLKLSGIDTGMKPKELEAYLNSKEFSNELKSEKVQNLLSSKEFLGKIQKKFEKLTNK